jgi:predicted MFS family arabinose efflux permease
VVLLVPTIAPRDGGAARGITPDARRYALLVVTTAVAVTGMLTAYTYIAPFLLDVSGFAPSALGPLLLVVGLADVLGTFAIGALLDRHPMAAPLGALATMAIALFGLYALGAVKAPAVALLALAGMAFSALAVAIQHRTLQLAPGNTDLAAAGISSAFNLGIAGGSLLGGVLISTAGVRSVALTGAILTALAFSVLLGEPRLARPAAAPNGARDARPEGAPARTPAPATGQPGPTAGGVAGP